MRKRHPKNERIKRLYFIYLEEAKRKKWRRRATNAARHQREFKAWSQNLAHENVLTTQPNGGG